MPLNSAHATEITEPTSSSKIYGKPDQEAQLPNNPNVSAIVFEQSIPADGLALNSEKLELVNASVINEQEAKQLESQTPDAISSGLEWSDNKEELVKDLLDLNVEIHNLADKLKRRYGKERLKDLVNKNEVVIRRNGFGKAELNACDGVYFVRVVHDQSKTAILIIPKKTRSNPSQGVDPNSAHLRQIIARQHIEANETGRNVVKMWLIGDRILETQYLPKDAAQYWRDYFYAKWKKPTTADFTMSLFAGAFMQGSLAIVATALKANIDPAYDFSWYPVVLTSIFGIGVGTFISTYKNWTRTGTPTMRKFKSSAVSLMFSYALVVGMNPQGVVAGLEGFNPFHWSGLTKNLTLLINAGVSNHTKDYWYQLQRFREELRENTKDFKPNIYIWNPSNGWHKKQFDTGWKQASLEHQIVYLVPWMLNVLQVMGLVVGDVFGIKIPTWHLISVPIAQYLLVRYSDYLAGKKANDPLSLNRVEAREKADKINKKWEVGLFKRTKRAVGELGSVGSISEKCHGFFNEITGKTQNGVLRLNR
ncbi:MAG: hypothetical protein SGI74_05635 [Oligoflexia bacterium]|nr:hypothetical protein [Oligoflexia bacterium]